MATKKTDTPRKKRKNLHGSVMIPLYDAELRISVLFSDSHAAEDYLKGRRHYLRVGRPVRVYTKGA